MKLKWNSKNSKVCNVHTIYETWYIVWYFTCYVRRRLDETIFVMYFSFVTPLDETCSQGKLLSIHQGHTYIDDLLNYQDFPTRLILSSTATQQNFWQLLNFFIVSNLWLFNYLNLLFIDLIFKHKSYFGRKRFFYYTRISIPYAHVNCYSYFILSTLRR